MDKLQSLLSVASSITRTARSGFTFQNCQEFSHTQLTFKMRYAALLILDFHFRPEYTCYENREQSSIDLQNLSTSRCSHKVLVRPIAILFSKRTEEPF